MKRENLLRHKSKTSKLPTLTIIFDDDRSAIGEMPVEDWIATRDHPLHRPKTPKATQFSQKHGSLGDTFRHVIGAEWQGEIYKVDGHDRAALWQKGTLKAPETVRITLYRPQTKSDFYRLYTAMRAPAVAVSRMDTVQAAFREHDLKLTSRRLKQGHLYQALSLALQGQIKDTDKAQPLDVSWAVGTFCEELIALDSVNPRSEIYQTGLVAAALIGLSLYPDSLDFFERISNDQGNKVNGLMDPVECVLSIVNTIRLQQTSTIEAVQEDLCARALRAQMAWIRGDRESFEPRMNNTMKRFWFKRTIQAADIVDAVKKMRLKKKTSRRNLENDRPVVAF